MDALGADLKLIFGIQLSWELNPEGLAKLDRIIAKHQPSLVIIDPLVAFMGGKLDLHKANQVRTLMAGLAKVAQDRHVAIVIVRHVTKGGREKAIYRGIGSIDITAACRSVLMAGHDPTNEDRRIIAHVKSNLAPLGPSLSYAIKDGHFEWCGAVDVTAEDLCRAADSREVRSALVDATEFLQEALKGGPVRQQDVVRQAKEQSIAKRTLDRAKKSLGVRSEKREGFWVWRIEES